MNQEELIQKLQSAIAFHNYRELDKAEAIYREVLAFDENNFYALNFSGCIQREKGDFERGISLLIQAVALQPGNPDGHYNLGNVYRDAERWEEAIGCYEKTVVLRSEYPEALNNLGLCLKEVDRYEQSLIMLRRAVKIQSGFSDAWLNLGNVLKKQGKLQEAIESYRKAIELKPDFVDAYCALGNVLNEEGEVKEAIESYRKAIELKPDFVDAYFVLGNVLNEEGEVKEAIESYRKAIELKPDFVDAYFVLGNVLKEEGEVKEAIECYRKAIELKPDFVQAYCALGIILKDSGRFQEAREIVSLLQRVREPDRQSVVSFPGKILVFDWHHCRVKDLLWEVEFAASWDSLVSVCAIPHSLERLDSQLYPPLFLGNECHKEGNSELYSNGFLVEAGLIPEDFCASIIDQSRRLDRHLMLNDELIQFLSENGVFKSILNSILQHAGYPHLIWNCIYFSKYPGEKIISDSWHYDNHYNVWTSKLMVYLNSQNDEEGATEIVDIDLSKKITDKSGYMGLTFQRQSYRDFVSGLVDELDLDPISLDPPHYTFSPAVEGTGVWFCPSRVLHRGVSPKKGVRHVLSFSLTPLPLDCGWSVEDCVEKSVEILMGKVNQRLTRSDVNPYWVMNAR